MTAALIERLFAYFWPHGDLPTTPQVYALLDGARDRRIEPMIRLSRLEYVCLYGGRLSPGIERVAPYLVHLTPGIAFTPELIKLGWGNSWGMFTIVPPDCTMQQQRRHLRTLLRVQTEDQNVLAFRFYDPRVMRAYLPTCTKEEVAQVFGPIPRLAFESADAERLLIYRQDDGLLQEETLALPLRASSVVSDSDLSTGSFSGV